MSDFKDIEKLFKDKLQDFEVPVRSHLWSQVSASAGIGTLVFWSKFKIVVTSIVLVVATALSVYLFVNSGEEPTPIEVVTIRNNGSEVTVVKDKYAESFVVDNQEVVIKNTARSTPVAPGIPILDSFGVPPTLGPSSIAEPGMIARNILKTDSQDAIPDATTPQSVASHEEEVVFEGEEANKTLNLDILIAPAQRVESTREEYHYPAPFPVIFNPNLSSEAGSFSVQAVDVSFFKVEIRNQRGQLIFASNDQYFVWNGLKMDGTPAAEGTYLFLIESNDLSGNALKPQSGSVFLMRK